jgi:SAM-dependent methyltransferase
LRATTAIHPIDVPTLATVSFIESNVPNAGSILEIGCGSGYVAADLSKRGYKVAGVESDQDALTQARDRGVEVIDGSWPRISAERVDAVVFTRSLHHISPLPEAIMKIGDVLLPNGIVLVEDFAFDEVSASAINWLRSVVKSKKGQALISHNADLFITKLCSASNPLNAWHEDHDHELHTFGIMTTEIAQVFAIRGTQHVPYLYRYLVPILPDTPKAAAFIAEIYDEESYLGEKGTISLIGRRIVADNN